jgi:hypothetical protein
VHIADFQLPIGNALLRLFMIRVLTAAPAELLKLQAIRSCLLVLGRYVIAALTIAALQHNVIAWHYLIPDSIVK